MSDAPKPAPACPLPHEPNDCHRIGIGQQSRGFYFECEASDHALHVFALTQEALVKKVNALASPPLPKEVVAVLVAIDTREEARIPLGEFPSIDPMGARLNYARCNQALNTAINEWQRAGRPGIEPAKEGEQ